MQEKKEMKIMIPEGNFEGYCDSCYFGKRNQKDAQGRILCKGEPGGYKFPDEKNNCKYYTSRIKSRIQIGVAVYIAITVLVILIEALVH